jgi:16S rRNA (cytidine1402-2'-O)-methyltransferase
MGAGRRARSDGRVTGRLVLVATPLGNLGDTSPRAVTTLAEADAVACEDTRHTGKLLTLLGVKAKKLIAVHEHNEASMVDAILERLAAGETVALVTDAGMPAVSDPGARIVRAAVDGGYTVSVVPGPSAGVAALAISGLPTDRWVFEGFLARKGSERTARLAAVASEERTVVLYEAPHRLVATLADLAAACGGERRVAVVRELTKMHEEVWRGTLGDAVAAHDGPRGEYVIVLEGGVARLVEDADIVLALREHPATATDRRAAVADVAHSLRVPRNRVYAASLRMSADGHVPRK